MLLDALEKHHDHPFYLSYFHSLHQSISKSSLFYLQDVSKSDCFLNSPLLPLVQATMISCLASQFPLQIFPHSSRQPLIAEVKSCQSFAENSPKVSLLNKNRILWSPGPHMTVPLASHLSSSPTPCPLHLGHTGLLVIAGV